VPGANAGADVAPVASRGTLTWPWPEDSRANGRRRQQANPTHRRGKTLAHPSIEPPRPPGGVDWAKDHHVMAVVAPHGEQIAPLLDLRRRARPAHHGAAAAGRRGDRGRDRTPGRAGPGRAASGRTGLVKIGASGCRSCCSLMRAARPSSGWRGCSTVTKAVVTAALAASGPVAPRGAVVSRGCKTRGIDTTAVAHRGRPGGQPARGEPIGLVLSGEAFQEPPESMSQNSPTAPGNTICRCARSWLATATRWATKSRRARTLWRSAVVAGVSISSGCSRRRSVRTTSAST
jgi:hypothetical protein